VRARPTTTTTIQYTAQHRDRPGVARRRARASRRARPGVPVRTVPPTHTLGFHMRPCAAGIRVAEFRHAAMSRRDPAIRRDPRSLAASQIGVRRARTGQTGMCQESVKENICFIRPTEREHGWTWRLFLEQFRLNAVRQAGGKTKSMMVSIDSDGVLYSLLD